MKRNRSQRRAAMPGQQSYLRQLRLMIARHGFAVQGVSASWDAPGWVYTIGLHERGLPELIVIGGMAPTHQHALIDTLARRMLDGEHIEPAQRHSGVIETHEVTYVEVIDTSVEWFAIANRLQTGFRALQVVLPDLSGRFPWEDGYDLSPDDQRLLGLP